MQSLLYYYSIFVQKVLRGKCNADSEMDGTVCINSGRFVSNGKIGRSERRAAA